MQLACRTIETVKEWRQSLTFQTGGTYLYSFNANRNNSRADEVIAHGVTIAGGATLAVDGKIDGRLNVGTTFPLLSNTAATPIAGTFAVLPDGWIITIHGNNLQASYEGGYGNDCFGHCGNSVPACSATMYLAYQSGQFASL